MHQRAGYQIIKKRLEEPRKFIQVVMGPRQVGKSTVIKQVLHDCPLPYTMFTADAVPATNLYWISECWETVRRKMKAEGQREHILVIDEVQKVNAWSEAVKKEWDADTFNDVNIKVVLLGSSRVMLDYGLADSLTGRFERILMPHWSYAEMRDAFGMSLEQYIYFGSYPGAAAFATDEDRWLDYISGSIVDATINKDILQGVKVMKPALLRQTFELASAYSGMELSLTKMIGQLQDAGNVTTLSTYLRLLGDAGLVCSLGKYAVDKARKRDSVPKYQVYNNALRNIYCEKSFNDALADPKLWGRLFESAIGAHIINCAAAGRYTTYYWRDAKGREVDYVIERNGATLAIEVKSNADTTNSGIAEFRKQYKNARTLVVGDGGLKAEEFLQMNPGELL
ncbi:MAG: ATP-binding protein [Salinivirgaceae bacterium]|nr:ATP-binding protein [Salinivirgaceae bacterium]